MSVQRHNVVIPTEDGGVEVHPLKKWLRQHPDTLPGVDPNESNSHQLRAALQRAGWTMQETPTEIRLIKPGTGEAISEVLGTSDAAEDSNADLSPAFSLEYQLRDFIASNLATMVVADRRLRLYVDATGRDGVEFP